MNLKLFATHLIICLLGIVFIANVKAQDRQPEKAPRRLVAVTFDDLPAAGRSRNYDAAAIKGMTSKLLQTFAAHRIPVVGFVNERGLYQKTGEVDERIAVLQMWLDAGHELGNHTFSHPSFNTTPPRMKKMLFGARQSRRCSLKRRARSCGIFGIPFFSRD